MALRESLSCQHQERSLRPRSRSPKGDRRKIRAALCPLAGETWSLAMGGGGRGGGEWLLSLLFPHIVTSQWRGNLLFCTFTQKEEEGKIQTEMASLMSDGGGQAWRALLPPLPPPTGKGEGRRSRIQGLGTCKVCSLPLSQCPPLPILRLPFIKSPIFALEWLQLKWPLQVSASAILTSPGARGNCSRAFFFCLPPLEGNLQNI